MNLSDTLAALGLEHFPLYNGIRRVFVAETGQTVMRGRAWEAWLWLKNEGLVDGSYELVEGAPKPWESEAC